MKPERDIHLIRTIPNAESDLVVWHRDNPWQPFQLSREQELTAQLTCLRTVMSMSDQAASHLRKTLEQLSAVNRREQSPPTLSDLLEALGGIF